MMFMYKIDHLITCFDWIRIDINPEEEFKVKVLNKGNIGMKFDRQNFGDLKSIFEFNH